MRTSSKSLSAFPPPHSSTEYSTVLANIATHILYRSPLPSQNDLPIFILNAAAFPDAKATDYDALLPYVLARLPDEDELIGGQGYEIIFFAGDRGNGATTAKKNMPRWGWLLQAYHLLARLTRKRLQKLYIVHERNWIRFMFGMFSTIVSPKFNKKVVHVSTLSGLALLIPIEDLLIPPSVYLTDRSLCSEIYSPYTSGKRAFTVRHPLPTSSMGVTRLPRVLRESTGFLLTDPLVKTEGIFRINARAVEVEVLKEAYDRAQKFVVWREKTTFQVSPYRRESLGDVWVDELEQTEGFGVYTAAGLIKQWYRDLRTPIFPQESYTAIEKLYGNNDGPLGVQQLLEMLSKEEAAWSIMPITSRQILVSHLLPMLSRVTEFQDWNQMTPYNLALCFAPIMLCGPDPIKDYKISTIIRSLLEAMITHWKKDLAPAFGMDNWTFEESLRLPESIEHREDPLEEPQQAQLSADIQSSGILLQENDIDSEGEIESKPPLPPRPQQVMVETSASGEVKPVRRKPTPATQTPPRYSMIVGPEPDNDSSEERAEKHHHMEELHKLPAYSMKSTHKPVSPASASPAPTIPRKPLPKTNNHD